MSTRRQSLKKIKYNQTTNAGLWLDKYITNQAREDKESRRDLVKDVVDIHTPENYSNWFDRWRKVLQDYGAKYRKAETQGRLIIGLGEESVLETSITLHHTYGVPYIPGSALKGLTSSFVQQHLSDEWQQHAKAYKIIFGDTESAGFVTFFDGFPLPGDFQLRPDIITTHHEKYYQNDSDAPPADWDDPIPIPFISVTGKFLIPLGGPTEWVTATFEILKHALDHSGIGAKTSSGYGRLRLEATPIVDPDQCEADRLIGAIQALRSNQVAGSIHAFYQQWKELTMSEDQKRRVAQAIVAKVKAAGHEKKSHEKAWYKELLRVIQ